jgi:amino acid permease
VLHLILSFWIVDKAKANFGGTIFTIINSIVGGGVVALPFVLKEAGLALGTMLSCRCIAFIHSIHTYFRLTTTHPTLWRTGNVLIILFGIIILISIKIMIATSLYTFGEGTFLPTLMFNYAVSHDKIIFRSILRCIGSEGVWSQIGKGAPRVYH